MTKEMSPLQMSVRVFFRVTTKEISTFQTSVRDGENKGKGGKERSLPFNDKRNVIASNECGGGMRLTY
jgi:hypothetical protein